VSDIDTAEVDSLKALDPEWPIREADIGLTEIPQCSKLPYCDVGEAQGPQPQARFRTVTTAAMWQIFLAKPV